ncbi:MAG: hypothetical protein N4A49_01385 [Marinifilaceae bacterium]|jgi:hypothetical protein|nr:hypothetical protein [Marinifilaceae bacterium]
MENNLRRSSSNESIQGFGQQNNQNQVNNLNIQEFQNLGNNNSQVSLNTTQSNSCRIDDDSPKTDSNESLEEVISYNNHRNFQNQNNGAHTNLSQYLTIGHIRNLTNRHLQRYQQRLNQQQDRQQPNQQQQNGQQLNQQQNGQQLNQQQNEQPISVSAQDIYQALIEPDQIGLSFFNRYRNNNNNNNN